MNLFVDVTYVLRVTFRSGIPRVVQEVLIRLLRGRLPQLLPIFFDQDSGQYRYVDPDRLLVTLELGMQTMPFLVTAHPFSVTDITPGDIFFDIDAVWHLSPRRSVLYPQLKAAGARIVSYVYDIIPVTDPQYCNLEATTKFLNYLGAVIDNADLLLASTQSTLDEISNLCDELGKPRIPGRATWLGADFKARLPGKGTTSDPNPAAVDAVRAGRYVLMIGTIQPLKNQGVVLDAFDRTLFDKGLNLVLAGKIGWDVEVLEKRIREHPQLGKKLFFLERMDDATIDYLYRNAFCLAFSTFREGFGLPTVEALQRGVPVVASDIPVLREVGGDFCRYFNPASPESFAETVKPLLESEETYRALREKVAAYRPVSWDTVSDDMAAILEGELYRTPFRRFVLKRSFAVRRALKRLLGKAPRFSGFHIRNGKWLSFSRKSGAAAMAYVIEGTGNPEDDYTWTNGGALVLAFKLKRRRSLSVTLRCGTFLPEEHVVAKVGGRIIADVMARGDGKLSFSLPADAFQEDGMARLTLELPDARSPLELGMSADLRRLALRLYALKAEMLP